MKVKVFLKDGRMFDAGESAIFDDKEAGWAVLSYGKLIGNRTNLSGNLRNHYGYEESDHIVYSWQDIEKIEVTQ